MALSGDRRAVEAILPFCPGVKSVLKCDRPSGKSHASVDAAHLSERFHAHSDLYLWNTGPEWPEGLGRRFYTGRTLIREFHLPSNYYVPVNDQRTRFARRPTPNVWANFQT